MQKHANFLLKICLSSLVFTASILATTSASISATETPSSITKSAHKNAAKANSVGGPRKNFKENQL